MVLRQVGERARRVRLHLGRGRAEHPYERLNGTCLRDRILILAIALGHLLQGVRRERAQLHERRVLDRLVREAGHHPHELWDAARTRDERLVVLRVAAELLDGADGVLLGLGRRRVEDVEERHDAVGVHDRLAIVLGLACEVGERGGGLLLRRGGAGPSALALARAATLDIAARIRPLASSRLLCGSSRVLEHVDQLLDDEHPVRVLDG